MSDEQKDVCVVGGGAAGLSAALFAARRGLRTIVLTKDIGGQTASTAEIENYPGLGRIEGPDLIARFAEEVREFGCEMRADEVIGIDDNEDTFIVRGLKNTIAAHAVILAFGKTPRDVGARGEKHFFGRGVQQLTVGTSLAYAGKTVAVVGGGNSALDAASRLSEHAACVYLIHRRSDFTGEQILLDRVSDKSNIEKKTPYIIKEIRGDDHVVSIVLERCDTNILEEMPIDAVFPAVGFEPRPGFIKNLVACDEMGRIRIDGMCATSVPGIFAAGDSTTVPYQQIVISAGEGAKAGISAYAYIQKNLGKRALKTDWGFVGTQ